RISSGMRLAVCASLSPIRLPASALISIARPTAMSRAKPMNSMSGLSAAGCATSDSGAPDAECKPPTKGSREHEEDGEHRDLDQRLQGSDQVAGLPADQAPAELLPEQRRGQRRQQRRQQPDNADERRRQHEADQHREAGADRETA